MAFFEDPRKTYPHITRNEYQGLGDETSYRALMLNEAREQTELLRQIADRLGSRELDES